MKYTGKALILALVLGLVTTAFVGCVGPESDDGSNTNGETTNKTTTQQTTQAPSTQAPTTNETSGGMVDSVVGDVSEGISEAVSDMGSGENTTAAESTTTTPARTRGMRGREGK